MQLPFSRFQRLCPRAQLLYVMTQGTYLAQRWHSTAVNNLYYLPDKGRGYFAETGLDEALDCFVVLHSFTDSGPLDEYIQEVQLPREWKSCELTSKDFSDIVPRIRDNLFLCTMDKLALTPREKVVETVLAYYRLTDTMTPTAVEFAQWLAEPLDEAKAAALVVGFQQVMLLPAFRRYVLEKRGYSMHSYMTAHLTREELAYWVDDNDGGVRP